MHNALLPAEIKDLQLETKRALVSLHRGMFRSRRKGYGTDFDQLREYEIGDDVRFIDWRGSARTNKLLIRQQLQENAPHLLLALDISPSMGFGATESKWYLAQKMGVVLATAAFYSQSPCSLLFFDNQIRAFYPALKGTNGLMQVADYISRAKLSKERTDFNKVIPEIAARLRKDMLTCVITDLIEEDSLSSFQLLHQKSEVVIIRCLDSLEEHFADVGILEIKDSETNQQIVCDTRELYQDVLKQRLAEQNQVLRGQQIDFFDAKTGQFSLPSLIHFFDRRLVRK